MRWIAAFAIGLLVLGAVVKVSVAQVPPLVKPGFTTKIAENVYVIPDHDVRLVPNIGILVGQNGILVVDTGMGPKNAETVLSEVRKISDKPILYLAITHMHPEHGMGAQSFPSETKVIYAEAQKKELADKAERFIKFFSGFSPQIAELLKPVRLVQPTETFQSEARLNLGGFPVQLLHFGASHTRGDTLIYLPEQGIIFPGDVVVNGWFPIMPDNDSSGKNWIATLEKLKGMKLKTVVPGHGPVGQPTMIDPLHTYLTTLRSEVTTLQKQGKSQEEVLSALTPVFKERYGTWKDNHWLKNAIGRFYAEAAM